MTLTFESWHDAWPDLPGWARAEAFRFLLAAEQAEAWEELAERSRLWAESEYLTEQRLYEEWPPPKAHQPRQQSTPAATSRKPGAVALATDDPLKKIEPRVYVEALTGEVVPANGWLRCPLPDTRTPPQASRCSTRIGGASAAGGVAASSTWRRHSTTSSPADGAIGGYVT